MICENSEVDDATRRRERYHMLGTCVSGKCYYEAMAHIFAKALGGT